MVVLDPFMIAGSISGHSSMVSKTTESENLDMSKDDNGEGLRMVCSVWIEAADGKHGIVQDNTIVTAKTIRDQNFRNKTKTFGAFNFVPNGDGAVSK